MKILSVIEDLILNIFVEKSNAYKSLFMRLNISISGNIKNEIVEIDFIQSDLEKINDTINYIKKISIDTEITSIAIEIIESDQVIDSRNLSPLEYHYFATYRKNRLEMYRGTVVEDNHTADGRVPLAKHIKYKDFSDIIKKFNLKEKINHKDYVII